MIDPCDICGDIGVVENLATCFQCKITREHGYCMRRVLLTIPEDWFCEECRLRKSIVPDSVIAEDLPMSSTSINSESDCTSPVLKPLRKAVDHENEMFPKSNTSKTLNPVRFLENEKRLGSASQQGASRVVNVKNSSVPSKSEHLARNLFPHLDQSNAMATPSKRSPTRSKVASTKASLKKFKPSHDQRILQHCSSKFSSTTLSKANQTSKDLKESSATFEKEKHDTFLLGKKIETSQSQQRDNEEVSPEGLDSLPVFTIASTLTESDIKKIATEYHIDTNRYHLSLPKSSERANSCFPGKHTFCIYAEAFKAGLRLPLHPLISEILSEFGVAPTQIHPNSWRALVCFISFCYSQKITPTVNQFRAIYSLKDLSGGSNKGWWYFSARSGFKLFEGFPKSNKGWRNMFFMIRTSERDTLGINTKWGPPNIAANLLPTLSATEFKELDDLVASAANNPPDIRVLLSEEALIQAGISSILLNPKGSENEMKQRHSLSQSGLVRALQRKRAATGFGKSSSGLPGQEPILIDVDQEDMPERKRLKESLQHMGQTPTELTNQTQEFASPVTSRPLDIPRDDLPRSNAEVIRTGSNEYTRKQSVFSHPTLARELISQMVLPHDCDYVAQKDTLVVAQELRCQAMEDATWKMGVSQKLIKMQHEINMLKEERNALRAELNTQKMDVAELESARKTTVELQRLEKEVERLQIGLKESNDKVRKLVDSSTKLKRSLKQAENHAKSAKRKIDVAEEKCRQSEMAKSRVAEETLKNFKASQEFQHEVEEYHAEAYGMGLNVAIEKIKRQYPDLEVSMIDFYAED